MKKILISLLLIGLLATVVGIGVAANFTSTATTGANFAAGTIVLAPDAPTNVSLNIGNMKPGDTASFEVKVINTGSLPCVLTAALPVASWYAPSNGTSGTDSAFSTSLALWVSGAYVGWDGTGGPTLAAGGGYAWIQISVSLDISAGNAWQGAYGTVTCALTGTQL